MKKRIVLLALSTRDGGICVAGKDITTSKWIRPVTPHGAVSRAQIHGLTLGDVVEVEILQHKPALHQTENYLYLQNPWAKVSRLPKADLKKYLESPPSIWGPPPGSHPNSLTPAEITTGVNNSLCFISVDKIDVETVMDNNYPKYYGLFQYNGFDYRFPLKDVAFREHPVRSILNPMICCSLGAEFTGTNRCYKLIAGII